jgi:hypothetical protein
MQGRATQEQVKKPITIIAVRAWSSEFQTKLGIPSKSPSSNAKGEIYDRFIGREQKR